MGAEALGWRPGLDGLRGVAVLAVMLYHFDATHRWLPGGSLGVDIFFVLSGFLITTLLLEERGQSGGVSLLRFYQRRARRLLPALFFFLAAFTLITLATNQPGKEHLPVTLGAGMFYVFNWVDDFGGAVAPGAGHLWSLSVEEQFYLVWPVVFILALRAGPRALLAVSVIVFAVAASLPAWFGRGYGEMYSGTDFRSQQLMAGAILAQLVFFGAVSPSIVSRNLFRALFSLAVAFFCIAALYMSDRSQFLYAGMYTVAAVAGSIVVCASVYSPSRVLTNAVMRYIGARSYALYLWHHAIAFWLRDADAIPQLALSVVLSFAAAEISWRLVESRGAAAFRAVRVIRFPGMVTRSSPRAPAGVSTPPAS